MQKSVIILGSGPGWERCPYDTETWIVGKLLTLEKPEAPIKRVDKMFSMDDTDHLLSYRRGRFTKESFIEKVNARNVPFISCVTHPDIPLSEEFPLKESVATFRVAYFTNTICYMIAYALMQGYTEIRLWGVAQMGAGEYVSERRGVEFWLGVAAGKGVTISIMTYSSLLTNDSGYPYGYMRTVEELAKLGVI